MNENAMLKNQRFGVEVEFTGITRKQAADIVAEVLFMEVTGPGSSPYYTRQIIDRQGRSWKVMRDSSINPEPRMSDEYKVEFVTPPLNYEDIPLLQTIIRNFRAAGAKANSSCGIHVHVDGANHNAKSIRRLVNFMTSRQDIIYEALGIGARADHWCKKLDGELLKEMKQNPDITTNAIEKIWYSPANDGYFGGVCPSQHYNSTRYHGCNLHAYFSKGTIEFRLFNSTLHAGKIKAYIQFCLAVSGWAITSDEHIAFKSMAGYTPEQKVTIMRNILINRLGLGGDEFKTCRLWMMKRLKDNAGMTTRIPRRQRVSA